MEVDQRVMGPGAVVTGGGFAGGLTEAGLGQLGFRSHLGVTRRVRAWSGAKQECSRATVRTQVYSTCDMKSLEAFKQGTDSRIGFLF